MDDRRLMRAGIPSPLWNKPLTCPGGDKKNFIALADDAVNVYERGDQLFVSQAYTREIRVGAVSWLAQQFGDTPNKFNREAVQYKHHIEAIDPTNGEALSYPFWVKMMDVRELVEKYKACDQDYDGPSFKEWVSFYDFFFLIEVGSEWPTSFNAYVTLEFFAIRSEAELPTVITLAKKISAIRDKSGENPYEEISQLIKSDSWESVRKS